MLQPTQGQCGEFAVLGCTHPIYITVYNWASGPACLIHATPRYHLLGGTRVFSGTVLRTYLAGGRLITFNY